jgi:hypothetical protein
VQQLYEEVSMVFIGGLVSTYAMVKDCGAATEHSVSPISPQLSQYHTYKERVSVGIVVEVSSFYLISISFNS